ncbi:hypothetical protein INR49_005084 [Caranx melampygus]|nr:hypothetical protein INR49_005084 [Caranx melampygus]
MSLFVSSPSVKNSTRGNFLFFCAATEVTVDLIPEQRLLWRPHLFRAGAFPRDRFPHVSLTERHAAERRQQRCLCVWTRGQSSVSFSVVFSGGTRLLVHSGELTADCDEDDEDLHHQNNTGGPPGPSGSSSSLRLSAQIFSSITQDPGSPHLLVCVLTGLTSPLQDVLWWVNDMVVTSSGADMSLTRSQVGGAYGAISVWEVSASDWRSGSTYWCGTVQDGHVFRQRLCWED